MIIRTILAAFILMFVNIMFILVGTTPALAASEEFPHHPRRVAVQL